MLVDIVNYDCFVGVGVFCEFDALVDLAMGLQHLEDGVLMDVLSMVEEEFVELSLK